MRRAGYFWQVQSRLLLQLRLPHDNAVVHFTLETRVKHFADHRFFVVSYLYVEVLLMCSLHFEDQSSVVVLVFGTLINFTATSILERSLELVCHAFLFVLLHLQLLVQLFNPFVNYVHFSYFALDLEKSVTD